MTYSFETLVHIHDFKNCRRESPKVESREGVGRKVCSKTERAMEVFISLLGLLSLPSSRHGLQSLTGLPFITLRLVLRKVLWLLDR